MIITLKGVVPSKKNSKQWIKRGGRKFLVPSDEHAAWHTEQEYRVKPFKVAMRQQGFVFPFKRATVSIAFFFPDRRRRDMSNGGESIMDLLVDVGILKDDCWTVVADVRYTGALDKKNPRAEITISQN